MPCPRRGAAGRAFPRGAWERGALASSMCGLDWATYNGLGISGLSRKGQIAVVQYRSFRNTDPPRIVDVWNECFTGRGAVTLRNSTPLETLVFAKPIFDPAGFFLA